MAIDLVFIPFIVTVIYVLGVSNIIKNKTTASVVSGILYGVIHIMNYNCSLECSFFIVLIPSIIIMLLTYLYKTTNNIWMVFISYILFKGLGYQILRYLP
jgi:membrane protease YdiL (CAAX protease family)